MHRRDQTHCKRGHPLSGENLYLHKGRRHCKACRREIIRQRRALIPPKPHGGGVAPTPWQERFWRYVSKDGPTPAHCPELGPCWEWTGARNSYGYGRLNRGGGTNKTIKAPRASYEIHHGVDPGKMDVCHHCDNPPCVNPTHLFLGDAKANAQDMARKGRAGPQNGQGLKIRKVTDAQVRELREKAAKGVLHGFLAAEYGIAVAYVGMLATGYSRPAAGGPFSRRR